MSYFTLDDEALFQEFGVCAYLPTFRVYQSIEDDHVHLSAKCGTLDPVERDYGSVNIKSACKVCWADAPQEMDAYLAATSQLEAIRDVIYLIENVQLHVKLVQRRSKS